MSGVGTGPFPSPLVPFEFRSGPFSIAAKKGARPVFSQRGLQTGIGMSISGGSFGEQRIAGFIDSLAQNGVDVKDLPARISL